MSEAIQEPKLRQAVLNPGQRQLDVWLEDVDGGKVRRVGFNFAKGNGAMPKAWWESTVMESNLQSGARGVEKIVVKG